MVEIRPKSWFFVHFERLFLFMPSYTLWVTSQNFAKWKTLLRYISVVNFISIAFVVVKLKIFKVFRIDSAFMKWSLLGGWKILQNFEFRLKWNSNWAPKCNKTVNFGCVNAMKLFCSILGPNLPPKIQKYCLKPKFMQ